MYNVYGTVVINLLPIDIRVCSVLHVDFDGVTQVHVLSDEARGPTLEAVVSRMKTIRATRPSHGNLDASSRLRWVVCHQPPLLDRSCTCTASLSIHIITVYY